MVISIIHFNHHLNSGVEDNEVWLRYTATVISLDSQGELSYSLIVKGLYEGDMPSAVGDVKLLQLIAILDGVPDLVVGGVIFIGGHDVCGDDIGWGQGLTDTH